MKAITNIHKAGTISSTATRFDEQGQVNTVQATEMQAGAATQGQTKGKPESELRAAARQHGLNLKELADRMGVNYGYLSSVASGRRPWTPLRGRGPWRCWARCRGRASSTGRAASWKGRAPASGSAPG